MPTDRPVVFLAFADGPAGSCYLTTYRKSTGSSQAILQEPSRRNTHPRGRNRCRRFPLRLTSAPPGPKTGLAEAVSRTIPRFEAITELPDYID